MQCLVLFDRSQRKEFESVSDVSYYCCIYVQLIATLSVVQKKFEYERGDG